MNHDSKENFDDGSECVHLEDDGTDNLKQENKLQLVGFYARVDIQSNSSNAEVEQPKVENAECCLADKQEDSVMKLIGTGVTIKQEQVDSPEYFLPNIDFAECETGQTKTADDIDILYENIKIETKETEAVENETSLNLDKLVQDKDSNEDVKPGFLNKSLNDCSTQLYRPVQVDDTNEPVFQCKVCSITFSAKNSITQHNNTHICDVCFRSSETNILNHSKERKCKFCLRSFNNIGNLVRHERTHTGEKRVPCEVCSKLFSSRYDLLVHQRIHTEEKPFECKVCSKYFSVRSNLIRHERTHEEKPFDCEVCLKNFSTASQLFEHEQVHTGAKPFDCKVCSKRFSNKPNLVQHERIHTGEKPFDCNDCSKAFYTRSALIKHERIHTGEKPFHCEICLKAFSNRSNLIQHERFHSGEKPFECKVCSKSFSVKFQLVRHKRIHAREKP